MTVASEIARLQAAKVDIMAALVEKGVDVTGKNLVDVPDLIDSIEVGPRTVRIGEHDYDVVKIGNKLWTAQNLDFKFSGLSISTTSSGDYSSIKAIYYNRNEAEYGWNGKKCGLLYSWRAVTYLNESNLLPSGWRVASKDDYTELVSFVGGADKAGKKLKAVENFSTGNGTDDFGFRGLVCGHYNGWDFYNFGNYCNMWTSTEQDSTKAYIRYFQSGNSFPGASADKFQENCIRLCKDA